MSQLLTTLSNTDRMISLQFSFNNILVIPWNLKDLQPETREQSQVRRQQSRQGAPSHNLFPKDEKPKETKIDQLPASLGKADYILVATQYQERKNKNRPGTYHMVRFIFARQEHVDTGDPGVQELEPRRGVALAQLGDFSQLAYWQVRAFRNPFYKDGKLIAGQYALSLNFDGRTQLFDDNSLPATPQDVPRPKHELTLNAQHELIIDKF